MAEIEKKPVKIVETILRDAHQSLICLLYTSTEFAEEEGQYMEIKRLEGAVEAILFAMGESVELGQIAKAIQQDKPTTEKLLHNLMDKYKDCLLYTSRREPVKLWEEIL